MTDTLGRVDEEWDAGDLVVNRKHDRVETVVEIAARAERAIKVFGPERVLLTPDCGFATFADSPIEIGRILDVVRHAEARGLDSVWGDRSRDRPPRRRRHLGYGLMTP